MINNIFFIIVLNIKLNYILYHIRHATMEAEKKEFQKCLKYDTLPGISA